MKPLIPGHCSIFWIGSRLGTAFFLLLCQVRWRKKFAGHAHNGVSLASKVRNVSHLRCLVYRQNFWIGLGIFSPSSRGPSSNRLRLRAVLRSLSSAKIEALARTSTTFGTTDGPITDKTVSWLEAPSRSRPTSPGDLLSNRLEEDKVPGVIDVEPRPGQGQEEDTWVKTTRSKNDLLVSWKVQLWKTQFLHPRTAEYAISGRPVAWDAALEIHQCLDQRWELYASTKDDVVKRKLLMVLVAPCICLGADLSLSQMPLPWT
ncbi:hypothetical protein B0H14DRAFT_2590053 [Mycena olivaceomarginata]|nr:hypothetical protein B0H14DRAFT_2590053 [Mycena olivaceomarginata]